MMEHRTYAFQTENVMKNNFEYGWDQEELWKIAKSKKIKTYKMNDVKHWVYSQCWSKSNCFISIFQVFQQPKKFPEHINRIKNADLQYPIIVIPNKYDKFGGILDGNHRFAKMILENKKFVKYVYITQKELEKIKIKI